MTNDSNIISLDIETYGAAKTNHLGVFLPKQTVFHPQKSSYIDRVKDDDMVLTVAITVPNIHAVNIDFQQLSYMEPGETFVFQLHIPEQRQQLQDWLDHADTILGMNLQFDLQYLRYVGFDIPPTKTLVDLSVLNYLHSELREERSLKALGPVLGTHAYSETLATTRFRRSTDEKLHDYNAQDTHNTLLAIAELSRRLLNEKFKDDNYGFYCLRFYSDSIWATIMMSENGVPMSSKRLQSLHEQCSKTSGEAIELAKDQDLILQGPGSATSKDEFLDEVITLIAQTSNPDILDRMDVTPKTKKVSFTKKNRTTLLEELSQVDDTAGYQHALELANTHSEALKLISSYCYPLLYHRRNKPEDMSSIIIPTNKNLCGPYATSASPEEITLYHTPAERVDAADMKEDPVVKKLQADARFGSLRSSRLADSIAYPTWYVTPSHIKNDTGSAGGTIQGRITCKQPSAQTFPKPIKKCIRSRFSRGTILAMDLSQAELRVAALLSGEKSMISAYNEGRDLHAERARTLWEDYDELPDSQHQRRQVGKMMNFADLFLSSANTMKEQVYAQSSGDIDLPLEFYQDVVALRASVRPTLTKWQRSLLHKAKVQHRILLPLTGQSRTFFGDIGKSRSEIVNFPVQTTAGNLTLAIQHRLMRNLDPKCLMFLQIYDAIYIDCPENMEESARNAVDTAVKEVIDEGYWADLQWHYGREVTLKHDLEVLD